MQVEVEWLERQYPEFDDESGKLLQIYRLLAGQVDDVLENLSDDLKEDARGKRMVGGCKFSTVLNCI
jgi:hypothetical protein